MEDEEKFNGFGLGDDYDDYWGAQAYKSDKTSINSGKLPKVFGNKGIEWKNGSHNLDYGGGRFDNATEHLKLNHGVTNNIFDPFNRDKEHNLGVVKSLRDRGGADTFTMSNVLNVINDPERRNHALRNAHHLLKPGGNGYITVYEGNGSGTGGVTQGGLSYQTNMKTKQYIDEISKVFGPENVKYRNGTIYVTKPNPEQVEALRLMGLEQ